LNAQSQIERLRDRGYVVVPGFVPAPQVKKLNVAARAQFAARLDPLEFEADLQYPGAPRSHAEAGGETVRRLLDAFGRGPEFAEIATSPRVREWMETYFGEAVLLSRTPALSQLRTASPSASCRCTRRRRPLTDNRCVSAA